MVLRKNAVEMCSLMAPGQSGFVSPELKKTRHYDDQLRLFEAGACKPDVVGAQSVDARLESSQTLTIKR